MATRTMSVRSEIGGVVMSSHAKLKKQTAVRRSTIRFCAKQATTATTGQDRERGIGARFPLSFINSAASVDHPGCLYAVLSVCCSRVCRKVHHHYSSKDPPLRL